MPATWKTVRVFISSTFRDMHAERNHLVRVRLLNGSQHIQYTDGTTVP